MGLFKRLFRSLFVTPEMIGRTGEMQIASKLQRINFFGRHGMILQNVYVPTINRRTNERGTSEIDLLYITQKGIFVIESKNYSGYIFGRESSDQWTATVYLGKGWFGRNLIEKNHFYNPIRQNKTHIKHLKRYLNDDTIPMFSLIVFSDRCEIKRIVYESDDVYICQTSRLKVVTRHIWRRFPDLLSENRIIEIYNMLLPLTKQDEITRQEHIVGIQKMMGTCPRCGGQLILRTAKKGAFAGSQFYGCANYPQCKYTRNIH